MVVTFNKSVKETLVCDHSNESYIAMLYKVVLSSVYDNSRGKG